MATKAAAEATAATADFAEQTTKKALKTTEATAAGFDPNFEYASYDDWCDAGDTACEAAVAKRNAPKRFFYWGMGMDEVAYCYSCNDNETALSDTQSDYPNYSMYELVAATFVDSQEPITKAFEARTKNVYCTDYSNDWSAQTSVEACSVHVQG
jgi:hypothetical protein